jgi:hypothetical protein
MSSRQEEKERRRRERLEQEEALQRAAAQRKRLQYVFGGVLAVLIVGGVVALAAGTIGGGGDDGGSAQKPSAKGVTLPKQTQKDLAKAAAAANCKVVNAPIEGNTHETKNFKASDYKTNPPTSGNHNPNWYQDGIYAPGDVPRLGMIVHPLEHGRIELQYKKGTPQDTVDQLEALVGEEDNGYHMLMFENTTNMPYAVAAAAWGHYVGCPAMNDKVWDALRTFHDQYVDKGPEVVP